jgi:hypothetical protein
MPASGHPSHLASGEVKVHDPETCLGLDFHQGRRSVGVKHNAEAWIFTGAGAEGIHAESTRLRRLVPVCLRAQPSNSSNSDVVGDRSETESIRNSKRIRRSAAKVPVARRASAPTQVPTLPDGEGEDKWEDILVGGRTPIPARGQVSHPASEEVQGYIKPLYVILYCS